MTRTRFFQLAVAAVFVAFVVARSHPGELRSVLRDINLQMAVLALILNLPVALLAPVRSWLLFRRLGHSVPVDVLVPTTIVGFVAGGLTPAASGEVLRAGPLRARAGVPFEATMAAVIYERVLSVYLLALTTAALFGLANLHGGWQPLVVVAALALCLLPWLAAVTVWPLLPDAESVKGRGLLAAGLRRALASLGRFRFLLEDAGLLVRWSLVTAAMFALIAFQYWVLARGVAADVDVGDAWIAFGVSTFAAVASLVPLGLGVLDGSLAATLDRLGATFEQGEVVAVLVRATVTLPLVLAAFASYVYLHRGHAAEGESGPRDAP